MTFKEFDAWCNERACDGCWGSLTAMVCIDLIEQMKSVPILQREKVWKEKYEKQVLEEIINPIEEKMEEMGACKTNQKKDLAFDRERAKYRKEIRERDSTIIHQLSKISELETELREANDKIAQQQDWIKRLLEYMDMPEDEMKKRIQNERVKDDIIDRLGTIDKVFGRFGLW